MNASDTPLLSNRALPIGGRSLHFPCFFPSVSSVKTNLAPADYIRVLRALQTPYFLVSAYDVQISPIKGRKISRRIVKEVRETGSLILLDGGGYESFWRTDTSWSKETFYRIVKALEPPIAFSFDLHIKADEPKRAAESISRWMAEHQRMTTTTSFIPLIHASAKVLPAICREVAARLRPIMIAIPERELGDGIIARMATVSRIRRALDKSQPKTPLHVLGTGNPRSLLLLTIAGADCYDGLEWCQTVVDRRTALLYHFQQLELLKCRCKFCLDKNLTYTQKVLAHNLLFYAEWTAQLQRSHSARYWFEEAVRFMGSDFVKHAYKASGLTAKSKAQA